MFLLAVDSVLFKIKAIDIAAATLLELYKMLVYFDFLFL
jgi:hypothetical protein